MDLRPGPAGQAPYGAEFDRLHANLFHGFPDLVRELGGDPDALLRRAGLDPNAVPEGLGYRAWVTLLELTAAALRQPDFGLQLAKRQGGGQVFGPIGEVMKNARTLGEAVDYAAKHSHAHSPAARIRAERDAATGRLFVDYKILLNQAPKKRQAMEHLLLLAHLNSVEITGGQARVRGARFRHQPLSPARTYRRYFGCDVRFGQNDDGVVFSAWDLGCPIVERDTQRFEQATAFIDARFADLAPPLHAKVRAILVERIGAGDCGNKRVAADLGLHTRTLHRKLKAEGKAFEDIKDEVRRDLALAYLTETDLPLTMIAGKLGYAEHSVLTRSCVRWFSAPPRQVRAQAACPLV